MRLLLDTNILIWWLQDDPKLSKLARSRIVAASEVFVSSASIWEAAIKANLGKLDVDVAVLISQLSRNRFSELAISHRHAAMVAQLPDIHRDPFDRMLVVQAICEPLRLLTSDRTLASYSDLLEVV